MSQTTPNTGDSGSTAFQELLQRHLQARLQALELQITREQQRQRDQVDEELHKMQQQLTALSREVMHSQHATLATYRESLDEVRKEVSEALHRLLQDVDHMVQRTETHNSRALDRMRQELFGSLAERVGSGIPSHRLGELFIALGKQIQNASRDETW